MCYTGNINFVLNPVMRVKVALFSALFLCTISGFAQTNGTANQPPAVSPDSTHQPKAQFFGGTVTALSAQQITVSHTSIGHSAERKTFLINPKTKLNRSSLKLRSRVTVRYQHMPAGDVALEILLQPSPTRSAKLS